MKMLKLLSDTELHDQVVHCATQEKLATLFLLEHLAEVDRRRLFALYGYASLWEYVCKELKYSESQAFERVNAMRLMVQTPEVRTELESGNLTLTSAAKLGSHVRREKLSSEKTKELLPQISGKSVRETESVLSKHQQELHPETITTRPDQVKSITDEITRITLDCDSELMQLLEQVKNLAGNPSSQPKEVFKIALKEFVKRRTLKTKNQITKNSLGSTQVAFKKETRYIPAQTKIEIRTRANHQCEFVSPITHKQCTHKMNLEIDHVKPHAKGGTNKPNNLQVLCKTHNLHKAIQDFGAHKVTLKTSRQVDRSK